MNAWHRHGKHFAGFLLLLFVVYAPVVFIDFGMHNDYRVKDAPVFVYRFWPVADMFHHAESMHLFYTGRPLNALLFNFQQSFFGTVRDFAWGRSVALLTAAACALMLYGYLRRTCRADGILAFALSFSVFTLPSCYTSVVWEANFIPGIFNGFFAMCVYALFDSGYNAYVNGRSRLSLAGMIAAPVLLLGSFMIYPPTAYFFLVFPFSRILFADQQSWPQFRKIVLRDAACIAASACLYFAVTKLMVLPFFRWYFREQFTTWDAVTYEFAFVIRFEHIWNRVSDTARIGLRLWQTGMDSHVFPAFVILVLAAAGISSVSRRFSRPGSPAGAGAGSLRERIAAAMCLMLMALSPTLFSPGGFVAYRIVFVPIAFLALAFVYALWRLAAQYGGRPGRFSGAGPWLMALVVCCVGIQSQRTIVNMSMNAGREYGFYRERLGRLAEQEEYPVRIQIRLPPVGAVFVDYPLSLDLAYLASNQGGLMTSIVHFVAEELRVDRSRYSVETVDFEKPLPPAEKNVLQMDLNDLLRSTGDSAPEGT